jgi:hypothetical protein
MATLNADGLYVKFGTEKGHSLLDAGDYKAFTGTAESVIEIEVDLVKLTEVEQVVSDVVNIPDNCQITKVEVMTKVAATTGVALDMGLVQRDRSTTTNLGTQAILAAFPTAEMAQVGETRRFYETHTEPTTMTGTGTLVGQIVPEPAYLTASRTTSTAFDTGVVSVRIYYIPSSLATVAN